MKMEIMNKTKWDTKDLKKVFQLSLMADNEIDGYSKGIANCLLQDVKIRVEIK